VFVFAERIGKRARIKNERLFAITAKLAFVVNAMPIAEIAQ